jgi:glucan phosphoethanolaminetransferase (alkaline phosphatase superfamily)
MMNIYCFIVGFLFAVLSGLLLVDILTTTVILSFGGTELNPVMNYVVHDTFLHFIVKLIFAIFVIIVACRAEHLKERSGVLIMICVCTLFFVAAVHNLSVILFGIF